MARLHGWRFCGRGADYLAGGGPDRRPIRCDDVVQAADGDDGVHLLLTPCQLLQHRLDGRQLGLDLPEG